MNEIEIFNTDNFEEGFMGCNDISEFKEKLDADIESDKCLYCSEMLGTAFAGMKLNFDKHEYFCCEIESDEDLMYVVVYEKKEEQLYLEDCSIDELKEVMIAQCWDEKDLKEYTNKNREEFEEVINGWFKENDYVDYMIDMAIKEIRNK